MPAAYVSQVVKLLDELRSQERTVAAKRPPSVRQDRGGLWPVADLSRLAAGTTRSHDTVRAILDLLAEQPGTMMLVGDVAEKLGVPLKMVSGALAGMTRLVKARHDYDTLGLPLSRTYTSGNDQGVEVRLGISVEQAERWHEARTAAP